MPPDEVLFCSVYKALFSSVTCPAFLPVSSQILWRTSTVFLVFI